VSLPAVAFEPGWVDGALGPDPFGLAPDSELPSEDLEGEVGSDFVPVGAGALDERLSVE
jgi:hypothetical protein